jgi:metallopeptidase family M12-like protein
VGKQALSWRYITCGGIVGARQLLLAGLMLAMGSHVASAGSTDPINLFTEITPPGPDDPPPPEDSLVVYRSTLDINGLAGMPDIVRVRIPRTGGDLTASVRLERMDRREGFGERDFWACIQGDPTGCEIIPVPGFPPEQFSYTWTGQGDGYDLRLTIHHGNAVGVLSGPKGRFGIEWKQVKELRVEYFLIDDSMVDGSPGEAPAQPAAPSAVPVMSVADARNATVARIEPQTLGPSAPSSTTQLDMLVLFTEAARKQAGGNPADCHDTNGVMTYIHQGINDVNTAFSRSQISAQVGVTTVTKLNGYALIPYNGNGDNIRQNRLNITLNNNIKAFRNAVGADVVTVLFDTQANLGVCGVANVQRHGCSDPPTPGCDMGPQFSEWTYYLNTVQCSATVDAFTHELGHVLGAEHDIAHTSIPPNIASYPYSYGHGVLSNAYGFETIMSQKFDLQRYPVRLLQFSNPNVLYNGHATGNASAAYNAHTLSNLLPGTAGFRTRPPIVFANGFDVNNPCPGINY